MVSKNNKNEVAIIDQSLIDACKALFANICFTKVDSDITTICVTSSYASEGKSTTSINLAIAIAQSGKKTLLVENDMRKRAISKAMHIAGEHDICDLIRGNIRIEDAIVETGYDNLYFLDVAPGVPSPSDVLSSERYARLVMRLKERFDYVIFDTPPTLLFVDSAIVSNLVDGTILVVREGSTKKSVAVKALAQLQKANANILGVSMSCCKVHRDDYYYYSYYSDGYGEKVKKSSHSAEIDWAEMERAEKPVWDVDLVDELIDTTPDASEKAAEQAKAEPKAEPEPAKTETTVKPKENSSANSVRKVSRSNRKRN